MRPYFDQIASVSSWSLWEVLCRHVQTLFCLRTAIAWEDLNAIGHYQSSSGTLRIRELRERGSVLNNAVTTCNLSEWLLESAASHMMNSVWIYGTDSRIRSAIMNSSTFLPTFCPNGFQVEEMRKMHFNGAHSVWDLQAEQGQTRFLQFKTSLPCDLRCRSME